MGAWSHQPFGNDDANDWAYGLKEAKDLSRIEETLDKALESDEYLEAPDGCEAIAAAEVLAKLLGKGTQMDAYAEDVDNWVKSVSVKPSPELLAKAQLALKRVLGEESELRELWEGSDAAAAWKDSIGALERAVGARP